MSGSEFKPINNFIYFVYMNKYSCIFYNFNEEILPTIPTEHILNSKHKFASNDFFTNNEITVSNIVKQMIHYEKYFYIPYKIEKINFVNIEKEKEKEKENIKNDTDADEEINENYENNLKYRKKIKSGNILLKYPNKLLTPLNNYLNSFHQIIFIYKKMLKSIYMLNENFIFSNNINSDNILITTNDLPIISNFSFSIRMNSPGLDFKKFILDYDPEYIQWPIELHLLAFIFRNQCISISPSNVNQIVNDLIQNNYILNNFSETIKEHYRKDGMQFLSQFVNKPLNEIISTITFHFKTWDNYSLSLLYLQIFVKIYNSMKNKKNKFIMDFMKLLLKNISFNPKNRLSIKNTKNMFQYLINNISKSEYKEIAKLLSHA